MNKGTKHTCVLLDHPQLYAYGMPQTGMPQTTLASYQSLVYQTQLLFTNWSKCYPVHSHREDKNDDDDDDDAADDEQIMDLDVWLMNSPT